MKFKVIDTEPPEQELRCPRCNNRFRTDPSIQMNLVLINNVLLPQCPICKTIEDEPEFKKEAKINIKDCTQTVEGNPVKIYEVYENVKFNVSYIHGAYHDNCGWWLMAVWNISGQNTIPCDDKLNLDLSDWKEKIPWDCLRPEIKYVTRDKNGDWFGHIIEPKPIDNVWDTYYFYEVFDLSSVIMPEGPSDWTEAIARRLE